MNDLKQLLHDNVAQAPPDHLDLDAVVSRGRSRVRRRRTGLVAGSATLVVLAVTGGAALGGLFDTRPGPASDGGHDAPVGPVLTLDDAKPAAEGRDFRVLTSWTNDNLDRANGQYFDGVTPDGLVVFRDGPHGIRNASRLALLDPATGEKDWLPDPPAPVDRLLEAGEDRIVYTTQMHRHTDLDVVVLDRSSRTWRALAWPGLPKRGYQQTRVGPDGRLYVAYERGGGLERFDLWSASLTDPGDVRDEHLVVGEFDFWGRELTWTTTHNEPNDGVHVRDLDTGRQTDFDPLSGDRCNQLSMQRTARYVVMYQYCGTHGGVRDDRVQVIGTDGGRPVVTIQGSDLDAGFATDRGVTVQAYGRHGGTFVYRFDTGKLERIGDGLSHFWLWMPVPVDSDLVSWHTPVNDGHGATQWLGRLR